MSQAFAYFDLQVNGYAGVDFNKDDLPDHEFHAACQQLRADHVEGVLATIITDEVPRMEARLKRLAAACRRDPLVADVIRGIHIEGPFISPAAGFVGAHPVSVVRTADVTVLRRLLDAGEGLVRMVTLAPECDPGMTVIRYLADHKILAAAGHCDPSLEQLRAAIDAGLSVFTHLGNGCPLTLHRHDNIIQRVLSLHDWLTICFIGDGVHIPAMALGNYLRVTGFERVAVVTDAISAAGLGPGRYSLGPQMVEVGDDLIARAADGLQFAGSTATMPRMAAFLRDQVGLPADVVCRLLYDNPRQLLGNVTLETV
jgi:N-acetylglucosamine-6-phosphate deacetylase